MPISMQFERPKHYCIAVKFNIVMNSHNSNIINECGNCQCLVYMIREVGK